MTAGPPGAAYRLRKFVRRHRWGVGAASAVALALLAGFVATALVSYWMIMTYLSRPNEQLARDLPVIENRELYRAVDSIEYLRMLEESGLFDEEVDDAM